MNGVLWDLAGPRLLADRISQAARNGSSVNLFTRQSDLVFQIADNLSKALYRIDHPCTIVTSTDSDPVANLIETMTPFGTDGGIPKLLEMGAGRSFVVSVPLGSKRWGEFIPRFRHAAAQRSVEKRPRIIFVNAIASESDIPRNDVALECFCWDRVVCWADIESLVHGWMPASTAEGTLRRVLVRTVVELALADVELIKELLGLRCSQLAAPHAFIEEWHFANRTQVLSQVWLDGRSFEHPANASSVQELRNQISHKIWRAQVGVLLPWVEEYRIKYFPKVFTLLPDSDGFGATRTDFEIGTIWYFLQRDHPNCRYLPLFSRLRKVRNRVAHRIVLSYDELRSDIEFVEKYT